MTAVDFDRFDAEALASDAALPVRVDRAVGATDEVGRRLSGPSLERRRLLTDPPVLTAEPRGRFDRKFGCAILEKQLTRSTFGAGSRSVWMTDRIHTRVVRRKHRGVALGLLVETETWFWEERGEIDQPLNPQHPLREQRHNQSRERVPDNNDVVIDPHQRGGDNIGIFGGARVRVFDREVRRDRAMPILLKCVGECLKMPTRVVCAMK